MYFCQQMSLPKQLKPGSDFSIVLHYKGFEKPGTIFEKGLRDSKSQLLKSYEFTTRDLFHYTIQYYVMIKTYHKTNFLL